MNERGERPEAPAAGDQESAASDASSEREEEREAQAEDPTSPQRGLDNPAESQSA